MNIEHQIEFDKVKEMWMERAVTDRAKEQIKEITFYLNERELRWQLKSTTDSRNLMEKLGAPPLQKVAEIKEILMAAKRGIVSLSISWNEWKKFWLQFSV